METEKFSLRSKETAIFAGAAALVGLGAAAWIAYRYGKASDEAYFSSGQRDASVLNEEAPRLSDQDQIVINMVAAQVLTQLNPNGNDIVRTLTQENPELTASNVKRAMSHLTVRRLMQSVKGADRRPYYEPSIELIEAGQDPEKYPKLAVSIALFIPLQESTDALWIEQDQSLAK